MADFEHIDISERLTRVANEINACDERINSLQDMINFWENSLAGDQRGPAPAEPNTGYPMTVSPEALDMSQGQAQTIEISEQQGLFEQHGLPERHGLFEQYKPSDQYELLEQCGPVEHGGSSEQLGPFEWHGVADQYRPSEQQDPSEQHVPLEQYETLKQEELLEQQEALEPTTSDGMEHLYDYSLQEQTERTLDELNSFLREAIRTKDELEGAMVILMTEFMLKEGPDNSKDKSS
ncbi:hypothetical protein BX616_002763 [Lobosporangium transversale]|uniref:Uncharacterized protein n=1 Tax=Lobosporangium transversale TaxID=64571 RepID=A0A1Y2GCF6_9FUNG|nr:hypothetical protein BCR41DRAFT_399838 [Lobosporangium transversale]KAF9916803.1 hypothetical protein BX616_002763 [Lobosporangium transversale]ORZ06979.1 hypothetical protein BCR41DRAFT_399838 [Lobosporangium transversale]|eukprot:XP_021877775.1 hypothetical protein BCR41DRAFT_399838 [Lobosporangium transversale]